MHFFYSPHVQQFGTNFTRLFMERQQTKIPQDVNSDQDEHKLGKDLNKQSEQSRSGLVTGHFFKNKSNN